MPYSGASGYSISVGAQFFNGAHHAVDFYAAQLSFFDLNAALTSVLPSCPPATRPPSSTTGTLSPSLTFGAPVTIWIVLASDIYLADNQFVCVRDGFSILSI